MDSAPAVQPEPDFLNWRRDQIRFESHFASRLGASIHEARPDMCRLKRTCHRRPLCHVAG